MAARRGGASLRATGAASGCRVSFGSSLFPIIPISRIARRCYSARGSPSGGCVSRRYVATASTAASGVLATMLPFSSNVMKDYSRFLVMFGLSSSFTRCSREAVLGFIELGVRPVEPWVAESAALRRLEASAIRLRSSSRSLSISISRNCRAISLFFFHRR